MNISADDRHQLRVRFEELLGAHQAAILMEAIPPDGWDPVVLQTDVAQLKTDVGQLKTDVGQLKTDVTELKTDVTELKTDVAHLKTDMRELKVDLRGFQHEVRQDFRDLERRLMEHTDLRVRASVGESTRLMVFAMLASQATLVGMVLAAVKLG